MTDAQREWARCRPWIEAALATNPFFTIEGVERDIERGGPDGKILWPGEHAAVVTEFITFDTGRALHAFAIGGENNEAMSELLERFLPSLEATAKAAGCRWLLGGGRLGWIAIGKKHGFTPVWHTMVKELE